VKLNKVSCRAVFFKRKKVNKEEARTSQFS